MHSKNDEFPVHQFTYKYTSGFYKGTFGQLEKHAQLLTSLDPTLSMTLHLSKLGLKSHAVKDLDSVCSRLRGMPEISAGQRNCHYNEDQGLNVLDQMFTEIVKSLDDSVQKALFGSINGAHASLDSILQYTWAEDRTLGKSIPGELPGKKDYLGKRSLSTGSFTVFDGEQRENLAVFKPVTSPELLPCNSNAGVIPCSSAPPQVGIMLPRSSPTSSADATFSRLEPPPSIHSLPTVKPRRRRFTVKHYSDASPSMHCHLCCRSAARMTMMRCMNIDKGICRKVVCERCFIQQGWNWADAEKDGWLCCHCRGACPERAQCYTYKRANEKRRRRCLRRHRLSKLNKEVTDGFLEKADHNRWSGLNAYRGSAE